MSEIKNRDRYGKNAVIGGVVMTVFILVVGLLLPPLNVFGLLLWWTLCGIIGWNVPTWFDALDPWGRIKGLRSEG